MNSERFTVPKRFDSEHRFETPRNLYYYEVYSRGSPSRNLTRSLSRNTRQTGIGVRCRMQTCGFDRMAAPKAKTVSASV